MWRGVVPAMAAVRGAGALAKEKRKKPKHRSSCLLTPAFFSLQKGVIPDAGGGGSGNAMQGARRLC